MIDLEEKIMNAIGFGQHYNYSNGSGSCVFIREEALKKLPEELEKNGLQLSTGWNKILSLATLADNICGNNYLTNSWIASSYTIQDAIYRNNGSKIRPTCRFFIFETRSQALNFWHMILARKFEKRKKRIFFSCEFASFQIQKRGTKILFPSL